MRRMQDLQVFGQNIRCDDERKSILQECNMLTFNKITFWHIKHQVKSTGIILPDCLEKMEGNSIFN